MGLIGDIDPLVAVREKPECEPFDEVIVSTLPPRVSHWLPATCHRAWSSSASRSRS